MSHEDYAGFVQRTPIIVSILLEPIAQVSLKYLFLWLQFISCQENNQQIVAYGSVVQQYFNPSLKGLG